MRVRHEWTIRIHTESPIYLMLVGMLMILFATPLRISALMSLGTWIIVGACLCAFGFLFRRKKYSWSFILALVLIGTVAVSFLFASWSYPEMVAALCFLEIPLFMLSYDTVESASIPKFIYGSAVVLSLYYIALSFTSLAYSYRTEYGVAQMPFMTLGFGNPNETAMILFACFVVLLSLTVRTRRSVHRCFLVVDMVWIFVLMCLTLSRSAILFSLFVVVMTVLYRKRNLPRLLYGFAFLLPLLYVVLSVLLSDVLSNVYILGDPIETGRLSIYNRVLENLDLRRLLVGDFSYRFQNLHNSYMSVFATAGLAGLIAFIVFLIKKYAELYAWVTVRHDKYIPAIGMISILLYSSGEAAFFTTGSAFAAMVMSVYFLCVAQDSAKEQDRAEGQDTAVQSTAVQSTALPQTETQNSAVPSGAAQSEEVGRRS